MILVFLMYALFASTFTISKEILYYVHPEVLGAVRLLVGGLLLIIWHAFFADKKDPSYRPLLYHITEKFHFILLLAFFMAYIPFVCEFWSLQYISSAKVCLIYNLSPFITALLAWLFLRKTLTIKQQGALCLGFFGFIFILSTQEPLENIGRSIFFLSLPEIVLLVAVITSAYGWIVIRQALHKQCSLYAIMGLGTIVGGLIALMHAGIQYGFADMYITNYIPHFIVFLIIVLSLFSTISYVLYGTLLTYYSNTFLSFAGFSTPLFAALFGLIFLNERITWHFYATAFIVLVALFIFYQDENW